MNVYTAMSTPTPSFTYCAIVVSLYVGFVILINTLFVVLPLSSFYGHAFTYADFFVGGIYVMRDLAQRAIGHKVIFAMILAAGLTYLFADEQIAIASLSALALGEVVDWAIYTYTNKPLSQRILFSASVSSPIDSLVFLAILGRLAPFEFALMTVMKMLGVVIIWSLRLQNRQPALVQAKE